MELNRPSDQDQNTIKNTRQPHTKRTNQNGNSGITNETDVQGLLKEKLAFEKKMNLLHQREKDNMYGHIQMLYSVVNNVIFTLNQHAVVINKEILPSKDHYLESRVMFQMFQNVVSGLDSDNLLNELTDKNCSSVFESNKIHHFNQSLLSNDQASQIQNRNNNSNDSRDHKHEVFPMNMTSNVENQAQKKSNLSNESRGKSKFNSASHNPSKETGSHHSSNHVSSSQSLFLFR